MVCCDSDNRVSFVFFSLFAFAKFFVFFILLIILESSSCFHAPFCYFCDKLFGSEVVCTCKLTFFIFFLREKKKSSK